MWRKCEKSIKNGKKQLDLRTEEIQYQSEYDTETVNAAVNSDYHFTGDEEAALLIPLSEINSEDIIRINTDGTIQLKKFDLPKSAKIITNNNSLDLFVDTICMGKNISDGIQQFLVDSYTYNILTFGDSFLAFTSLVFESCFSVVPELVS